MRPTTVWYSLLLFQFWVDWSCGNVINISNGPISGDERDDFYAYRGIPYAQAPVGELRLAPPKPNLDTWSETREFKEFGCNCASYSHIGYKYGGNEDCLFLNVYVPKMAVDSAEKLPVLFYIHGGCYMFGSGDNFAPDNIMSTQNMILVKVNYRLGILGF